MPKRVWRFQGDVALNETDPMVTVFLGNIETNEDTNEDEVRQDVRNPVTMPLSEFVVLVSGPIKHDDVVTKQQEQKAERAATMQAIADAEAVVENK